MALYFPAFCSEQPIGEAYQNRIQSCSQPGPQRNYPDTPGRSPLPGLVVDKAGAIYGAMAYNGASIFKVTPGSGGEAAVVAVKGGAVPGEPDGTLYTAFGPVTGGPFSGTLESQRKKTAAVFGSDGRVLLRIGGSAPGLDATQLAKLGAPNGDAVLATLKSGPGGATAKNDTMAVSRSWANSQPCPELGPSGNASDRKLFHVPPLRRIAQKGTAAAGGPTGQGCPRRSLRLLYSGRASL